MEVIKGDARNLDYSSCLVGEISCASWRVMACTKA